MSKLKNNRALTAALTAAAFLVSAAPSPVAAKPILTGGAQVVAPMIGPLGVNLLLIEKSDDSLKGQGKQVFHDTGGWVEFDLTSYEFVGDTLCVAGPITAAADAPPNYSVGATVVYCVEDNGSGGSGSPDKLAGNVGPPGLTIQQILGFIGPPEPEAYQPITAGNLTIH